MTAVDRVLLGLQAFHVAFLALHDFIPLGGWSDPAAAQRANGFARLVISTALSTAPFAFGLAESVRHAGGYPGWLVRWLWWSYGLLFARELRAWWIPYLFGARQSLIDRYEVMFGRTAAFLPRRRGIQPNTLHVLLHAVTVLTLLALWLRRG